MQANFLDIKYCAARSLKELRPVLFCGFFSSCFCERLNSIFHYRFVVFGLGR